MENQPQNPEFRNNPENFHPCLRYLPAGMTDLMKLQLFIF